MKHHYFWNNYFSLVREKFYSFLSKISVLFNVIIVRKLEQQSMVHYCKYPLFTFDLYLGAMVTQNVAQYPLQHVTYAPAKLEVAMSNG